MVTSQKLQQAFPKIRKNEPLSRHSSFKVGGPADWFYELKKLEELPRLIKKARAQKIPYFVLGSGSNVLFSDEGFRGLVIKITAAQIEVKGNFLKAEAGAKMAEVIKKMGGFNLGGLEEFAGLPGTIGGAVAGNAGCFGKEIGSLVKKARIFRPEKPAAAPFEVDQSYFDFGYRTSRLKKTGEILLEVTFELTRGSQKESQKKFQEFLKKRREKQPAGLSAGSFFKNPPGPHSAGYLIEQAGGKGLRIGDAQVSEKHTNFILNKGKATARDILTLAAKVKEKVNQKFGIELEEEVVLCQCFLIEKDRRVG